MSNTDPVVQARQAMRDLVSRREKLDADFESLKQQQRDAMTKMDATLSDSDEIAFTMAKEALDRVKQKMSHCAQSRGLVQREIEDARRVFNAALEARTKDRTKQMRAHYLDRIPGLKDKLAEAAEPLLIAIATAEGLHPSTISLDRVLESHINGFKNTCADTQAEQVKRLQGDSWTL